MSDIDLIWEAYRGILPKEAIQMYVDDARVVSELEPAVNELSKHPRFGYTGPAYRAIYFPLAQAGLSTDELLQIAKTNPTKQSVFAWSKSPRGMEIAMEHAMDDGSLPYELGIILHCQSITAVDVNKLLPTRPQVMKNEQEILSLEQSNFTVVGYMDTCGIVKDREEFLQRLSDYLDDQNGFYK